MITTLKFPDVTTYSKNFSGTIKFEDWLLEQA